MHNIGGGPRHAVQHASPEVEELIRLVQGGKPAYIVAQWLSMKLQEKLDAELELLATWALSMDADLNAPMVAGPYGRGLYAEALKQLASQMRRKFAKALRDHQRAEDDFFTDNAEMD